MAGPVGSLWMQAWMDLGCFLGGEAGRQDKGESSTLHSVSWKAPICSSSVWGAGQTRGTGDPGDQDLVASSCQRVRKRSAHLSMGLPLARPPGGRQCQKETPPPWTSPKITLLAAISEVKP